MPKDVVCLSETFDLKQRFAAIFAQHAPEVRLLDPSEVSDLDAIRFALAHDPAPDAFERFAALKLICAWGAGVDGLILHPGLPAGVAIKRMTDPYQAQMMAAFAAHYVTGWHRRMFDYPDQQARAEWRQINWTLPADFPVGLLGFGKMGAAIARSLVSMGFPVTAWAHRARIEGGVQVLAGDDGFAHVIGASAAVINVLPLTSATRGILDAGAFAAMRGDAILIQIGRGEHVVEADLLAALDAGRPALAALDVMMQEPLPAESPLWRHPKVRITPHAASCASDRGLARSVAEGIAAFERGERPEGLVDRARGY